MARSWCVVVVPAPGDGELVTDRCWTLGTTGVHERDDGTLLAGFLDEQGASAAARALAGEPSVLRAEAVEVDDEEAWAAWREALQVSRAGPFVVRPPWLDPVELAPGEHELVIDPGRAFGDGHHPSTRLCLRLLPGLVRPGMSVLDVGCGTGVLAIAALVLGAGSATGVDVDPEALRVSALNAEANGVADRFALPGERLELMRDRFDLVLANLLAPVLVELAPELVKRVGWPDGRLVVAGIVEGRWDHVVHALAPLRVVDRLDEAPWLALVLGR